MRAMNHPIEPLNVFQPLVDSRKRIRRSRSLFAFVLFALASLSLATRTWAEPATAADSERPNFVICMTDDQGWGDAGYQGHPVLQTPVLDEMAASGLRFDRFYAAHPVCSPTRGSVLTGRNPNRFGCFCWGYTLRPEEITFAEVLRKHGYTTGHFGKWHLGSIREGDPVNPGASGFDRWLSTPNFFENDPLMSDRGKIVQMHGESSEVTAKAAIEFIQDAKKEGKPFLAVVWFGSPHTPHQATEELKALYPDCTEKEKNYYGEITGADRAMGMLRRELRELDLAENTLLWFMSDNGQQGNSPGRSGGLRGAKGSLWEGGIRVPGIMEWPRKIPAPRATSVPAITSDIYPTLLELAGAKAERQPVLDGVSLVSLIENNMNARAKPIGFWVIRRKGLRTPPRKSLILLREQRGEIPATGIPRRTPLSRMVKKFPEGDRRGHAAWLDGSWKLHALAGKERPEYQLYNLDDDPKESKDLASEFPDRVDTMRKQLESWRASVVRSMNGEDYAD